MVHNRLTYNRSENPVEVVLGEAGDLRQLVWRQFIVQVRLNVRQYVRNGLHVGRFGSASPFHAVMIQRLLEMAFDRQCFSL